MDNVNNDIKTKNKVFNLKNVVTNEFQGLTLHHQWILYIWFAIDVLYNFNVYCWYLVRYYVIHAKPFGLLTTYDSGFT